MYKGSASELKAVINATHQIKQPLFISGPPGVGKSMIVKEDAKERAKLENLEFIDWNASTEEQKNDMFATPEKYYVFIDQRLSQFDVTDLRGIPQIMSETKWLISKPYAWAVYITQPNATGTVFFDEINLASPIVAGSAYQIINDRVVADTKLSDNIYIVSAGNRAEDQAHTFDMPLPLRDRFCEFELLVNSDEWCKWAMKNKVNHHLINLIKWKGALLYNVSTQSADKATTPRGVVRTSNLLTTVKDVMSNETYRLTSISCGEGFAAEFQAYVKYFQDMNWDHIYNEPSVVKSFDVSKTYALIGGLVEHFQKNTHEPEEIIEVIANLKPDFSIYVLRIISDYDNKRFQTKFVKNNTFRKYAKENEWATFLA
jgi:hypothetical protein